jgi:glycosyltransferase involved in cell wall biosynthesis
MKKVLLVSFFYPPIISPGGVRPFKLKKYLPEFGWHVVVLTVGAHHFPVEMDADVCRVACKPVFGKKKPLPVSVSEKIQQIGQGFDVSLRSRVLRKIGWQGFSSFHYPGLENGWISNAYIKGCEILSTGDFSAIISSFPPVASHCVASKLAAKFRLPWVADYRDEWSHEQYMAPRSGVWKTIDTHIEKQTIRYTSHLTTVSAPISSALKILHEKEVSVIPNGYDMDDYPSQGKEMDSGKFSLTFTGHLNPKNHLSPVLHAVADLAQNGIITEDNFALRFVGKQRNSLTAECDEYNIEKYLELTGWVPYKESLNIQVSSHALLFPFWNTPGSEGVLSSKLFTYLGAARPILFFGSKSHIISDVLAQTGAGLAVDTVEECKDVLRSWIQEWRRTGDIKMNRNEEEIAKYSRKYQAGQFADIINNVVQDKKG